MPKMPSANIYWDSIPKSACVVDRGMYFEVKVGRKRAVAYWTGQTASVAQKKLHALAKKGCKR